MAGTIQIDNNESVIMFTPSIPWKPGQYFLEAESRLEDNAGNNLNRLFDMDLMQQQPHLQKDIFRKPFLVK